ncbi:MAG: hypothetical protein ACPLRW_13480 [Moorellales bacterium]
MQLNVYVPKERETLLRALDAAARATGKPKNEIVLEALERHLATTVPEPGIHSLGKVKPFRRSDLYEGRPSS